MLTSAELIEFIDNVVQFFSKRVENDSEFSLLFLHVHEKTEERWDKMILSSMEKSRVHLPFSFDTRLFLYFSWVDVFLFLVGFIYFFIFLFRHGAVFSDAKLLTGSFGQAQSFEHLLKLILKFGAWATWPSELLLEFGTCLFDYRVVCAIFKFRFWMHHVNVVLVSHDVVSCLALWQAGKHRWALRLRKTKLIVDQVPNSFTLRLVPCGHLLLTELTPGAVTDDTTDLYRYSMINSQNALLFS